VQVASWERIQEYYISLQGIRILPLGVYYLSGAVYDSWLAGSWQPAVGLLLFLVLALSIALYSFIGKRYKNTLEESALQNPQVAAQYDSIREKIWKPWLLLLFGYVVLLGANLITQKQHAIELSIVFLIAFLAALFVQWRTIDLSKRVALRLLFLLLVGMLILFTGHLPGVSSGAICQPGFNRCVVSDLIIGAVILAGGAWCYYSLRRNLKYL